MSYIRAIVTLLYFYFTVGSAPKFRRTVIKDRIGLVNESIQLQCKVKGNPRPFLIWLYNGEPVGSNKRWIFNNKVASCMFESLKAMKNWAGQFVLQLSKKTEFFNWEYYLKPYFNERNKQRGHVDTCNNFVYF